MESTPQPENLVPVTPDAHLPLPQRRMKRRRFLLLLLALVVFGYFIFWRKPPRFETKKRLVILGFDGCDPRLIDRWKDDLPNLRRLSEQGCRRSLRSTVPPESPVAWSSFAIGANPGQHGVYDFLRRPAGSYKPTVESFVERGYPKFLFKEIPIKLPKAINRRGGTAFWDVLSQKGVETAMLEIPCTFPAPNLSHGHVLSGLGVPDIRGNQATFHAFLYPPDPDKQSTTFGGKIIALRKGTKDGQDVYTGHIWGPDSPVVDEIRRGKEKERLEANLLWCEWDAHLMTALGERHATPEDRRKLEIFFGLQVLEPFSLYSYLHTDDFAKRIEAMRLHIHTGQPFVKKEGATAADARNAMADSYTKSKELTEKIKELSPSTTAPADPSEKKADPKKEPGCTIFAPIEFRPIDAETLEIRVQDQARQAKLNAWSEWFTVSFPVTRLISVQAICKFYPQKLGETIDIFMTSPDIDPRSPAVSISSPGAYSKQMAEWVGGPYKTRGWCEETHGLNDRYLSEEGFMDDLLCIMKMREEKTFQTLERTDNNVFISVFSETDRAAHMFFQSVDEQHPMHAANTPEQRERFAGYFKKIYTRMDEIVGRMMNKIGNDPDTLLMVMSDHGFSSFRYQVGLNTWLWKNGYLTRFENMTLGQKKLDDLENRNSKLFEDVDWSRTKAYSMGLGQIYINLKGREPLGSVDPKDYDTVVREICDKMATLTDDRPGRNGVPVFEYVKTRGEIWTGPYANDAHDCPDIQVGFQYGYRVSWQTCLGGIEPDVISDNREKWSGDHCSLATEAVPGMFFCNRKIEKDEVSIFDFAPTVLRYFGFDPPQAMEGTDLLAMDT